MSQFDEVYLVSHICVSFLMHVSAQNYQSEHFDCANKIAFRKSGWKYTLSIIFVVVAIWDDPSSPMGGLSTMQNVEWRLWGRKGGERDLIFLRIDWTWAQIHLGNNKHLTVNLAIQSNWKESAGLPSLFGLNNHNHVPNSQQE